MRSPEVDYARLCDRLLLAAAAREPKGEVLLLRLIPSITEQEKRAFGAILAGDLAAVDACWGGPFPLDYVNGNGLSPLMLAALCSQKRAVELLLGAGVSPDPKPVPSGRELPASDDAEPDAPVAAWRIREAIPPLHAAVRCRNMRVARLLLHHGANVNAAIAYGYTALYEAIRRDDPRMLAFLIDSGADVNALWVSSPSTKPDSPLLCAISLGRAEIAELLIGRGADTECVGCSASPLGRAAGRGDLRIVRSLLARGVSSRSLNDAFFRVAETRQVRAARLLLNAGTDPDVRSEAGGPTPLWYAASLGAEDVAKLLIERGAEVSCISLSGRSPLAVAASGAHARVVGVLIRAGADVGATDSSGDTPLHCAARQGKHGIGCVSLLLLHGGAPCAQNSRGETPLHCLVRGLGWRKDDALLIAGCRLLLDRGADASIRDSVGKTAAEIAYEEGHLRVAVLLKSLR
jgi:ankyrin repeat protein